MTAFDVAGEHLIAIGCQGARPYFQLLSDPDEGNPLVIPPATWLRREPDFGSIVLCNMPYDNATSIIQLHRCLAQ